MKHPIATGYVEEVTKFLCPRCRIENSIDGDAINRVVSCAYCLCVVYVAEPTCPIPTGKTLTKENERAD